MRKILLVLFVLFCYSNSGFAQTVKTVKITPKNFAGIIKKGETYSEQKLSNGIILGYKDISIGRGYLEFDLAGKIPSDATIKFVELKLASKKDADIGKFGGVIRLEVAPEALNYANASTWSMIKTLGYTGDYIGIEHKYDNPSSIYYFSDPLITNEVKGRIGRKVAFMLNHKNENVSTHVHLSGLSEDLYLYVQYEVKDSPQIPWNPIGVVGKTMLYPGNIYGYVAYDDKGSTGSQIVIKEWIYDKSLFDVGRKESNLLELKPKVSNLEGIKSTTVSYVSATDGKKYDLEVYILGNISVSQNYICGNELVILSLPGFDELEDKGATISWLSEGSTVIESGQGTSSIVCRGKGRGSATIKAIIDYTKNKPFLDENEYILQTQVWAGRPGLGGTQFISQVTAPLEEALTYRVPEEGATSYIWTCSGNSFNRSFTTNGSAINIRFHQVGIYTIICRAINVCGEFTTTYEVTVGGMTGGPEEIILKSSSASTSSPVTVKVYTFSTGTLVYSEKNVTDFNIQNTTLKDGIYVVVTTDQNGETKSEKVAKTRN